MKQDRQIEAKVDRLRKHFLTGQTRSLSYRRRHLLRLKAMLQEREEDIFNALKEDLNKTKAESFLTEFFIVMDELNYMIKHLPSLARPKRKMPSIGQLPGSLKVHTEALGVVLVIAPWNYPFLLSISPLIGALAAGNTVLLKPSAYAPATSRLLLSLCEEIFPRGLVEVVEGGREENKALLQEKFDYIFFTGSPAIGKTVMRAASKHLTPVTLELGGKSPCIVDATADIPKTAKRILFGKLLNAGQTCIAPDYVYVEESVKDELIDELLEGIKKNFPITEPFPPSFPKIIQKEHYDRLHKLLDGQRLLYPFLSEGILSKEQSMQIYPVLVDEPDWESRIMQEEIFGPILPILSWSDPNKMLEEYKTREKPLALYVFSKDKHFIQQALETISSGGVTINDTLLHLTSTNTPFGGVGNSGMGKYHGKDSFYTFSHRRTILKKWWSFDLPQRHPPISNRSYRFLRKVTGN